MLKEMGERLRLARKERGLTQRALADKIGIRRELVSCYENGSRAMPIKVLRDISNALGCSADYLLGNNTAALNSTERFVISSREAVRLFARQAANEVEHILIQEVKGFGEHTTEDK